MAATSQDVIGFKAQFPAFATFIDADIAAAFGLADIFTDPTEWNPAIYAKARMLWVANQLVAMRMMGGLTVPGTLSSSITAMGDLFVRERRFGERAVSYDQRQIFKNIAASAGTADASLSLTLFGLQYMALRDRTFPAVAVV
jgi:uncharacterized protein DUF4054